MQARKLAVRLAMALTVAALTSTFIAAVRADVPGQHPHFLHAIGNLRKARALLRVADDKGPANATPEEQTAINDINDAIRNAKSGAVDDGLDLDKDFPPDHNYDHRGRLKKARKLLHDALHDETGYNETDPNATDALGQSIAATRDALKQVELAIAQVKADKMGTGINQ